MKKKTVWHGEEPLEARHASLTSLWYSLWESTKASQLMVVLEKLGTGNDQGKGSQGSCARKGPCMRTWTTTLILRALHRSNAKQEAFMLHS